MPTRSAGKLGSLAQQIEAERPLRGGCTVSRVLNSLDPADRGVLEAALENPAYESTAIARALKKLGVDIQAGPVQRHRRAGCRCPR